MKKNQNHEKKIKILLFLLPAIALFGCKKDGGETIKYMIVASERTAYNENATESGFGNAYIVKFSSGANWEILPGPIHGLDWEPGFEYEIEVREIRVDPALQDRPSVEHELIRVLSKRGKQAENLPTD